MECLEMTQITNREKIELLKGSITQLYCVEGRGKSYIARLLELDRTTLTKIINYEWKLEQAQVYHMTPSNQKFVNKHRNLIKSRLDKDVRLQEIAEELGVTTHYLNKSIIPNDPVLARANQDKSNRMHQRALERAQRIKDESRYYYDPIDLHGEQWKEILGYPGYFISSKGRVKSYVKRYKSYKLLSPQPNKNNGRMYVWIDSKGLQVARLVGFAFVDGHSEIANTIEHKDNNVANNCADNLAWVSQAENNRLAYVKGKAVSKSGSRYPKEKTIIVNGKYEFKTVNAFAKFIGKSPTQARRYLDGDVANNPYKIQIIY